MEKEYYVWLEKKIKPRYGSNMMFCLTFHAQKSVTVSKADKLYAQFLYTPGTKGVANQCMYI